MLVPRRVSAHHLKFSDASKTHTSFFWAIFRGARCCETSGAFCWHLLLVDWQRGCALGYAFRGAQKVNEKAEGWVLVLQQMCLNTLLILGTFITEMQLQNTKFLRLFSFNLDQIMGFVPCFLWIQHRLASSSPTTWLTFRCT